MHYCLWNSLILFLINGLINPDKPEAKRWPFVRVNVVFICSFKSNAVAVSIHEGIIIIHKLQTCVRDLFIFLLLFFAPYFFLISYFIHFFNLLFIFFFFFSSLILSDDLVDDVFLFRIKSRSNKFYF